MKKVETFKNFTYRCIFFLICVQSYNFFSNFASRYSINKIKIDDWKLKKSSF